MSSFTYDPSNPTDIETIRLLLNDIDPASPVFQDEELQIFLTLEGGHVKLAAAQAIDANASNEALASKVLRTQDLQTDGAKLAQVLHAHAEQLRNQHANAVADADAGFFEIIDTSTGCGPEHASVHGGWY